MPHITKQKLKEKLRHNNIIITSLMDRAFDQAEQSHGTHKRMNGEPSLSQHIYPVAYDLIDYCNSSGVLCSEEMIVAALLHDVLEDDKKITRKEFMHKFGLKIYTIVHTITKDYSEHELNDVDRILKNADYWKNILKSGESCLLIKLADKANNLESDLEIVDRYPEKVKLDIENIEFNYLPYTVKHNKYYHEKLAKLLKELKKYLNKQST